MNITKLLFQLSQTAEMNKYVEQNKGEMVFIDNDKLQDLHRCFLYMLKDFDAFCESNRIRYSLIGGALLGKIRHNGFIPWDDDLDIVMPREDAERFKDIFNNSILSEKYILKGPGCADGVEVRILKMYKKDSTLIPISYNKTNATNKIFMDIFVLDYVPENKLIRNLVGIKNTFLLGIISCIEYRINGNKQTIKSKDVKGKILAYFRLLNGYIFSFHTLEKWYIIYNNSSYYKKPSSFCTIATGRKYYFGEIAPTTFFMPFKRTDFCGVQTWILNETENYLKHFYGDYMRIPKENERETHYVHALDIGKLD